MNHPPVCRAPDPDPKVPKHLIPRGACDCHFHVFDAPSTQVHPRSYTAPVAPLNAYSTMQETLGLERGVVVQPSVYGTDNATTLNVSRDNPDMRAIVVVDEDVSLLDLEKMAAQGAVGARLNLLFESDARLNNWTSLTAKLAELGWHLQILADVSTLPDIETMIADCPVPIVFDHFGHLDADKGIQDPGFQTLLKFLGNGSVWVKFSGAYRIAPHLSDVLPLAQALTKTNPDQLVWGTDWPHPAFEGEMPNDGDLLDLLFDCTGHEAAQKILVGNPQVLYGFPDIDGVKHD